jgi:hypothetical protein
MIGCHMDATPPADHETGVTRTGEWRTTGPRIESLMTGAGASPHARRTRACQNLRCMGGEARPAGYGPRRNSRRGPYE